MPTHPPAVAGPSDLLRGWARARPDDLALVSGADRLSAGELDRRVTRAAVALRSAGAGPGERVALRLPSAAPFVVLYLGALRAGAVAVPVNPAYTPREVEHIRGDCDPVIVLDPDSAAELLASAPDGADPHGDARGEQLAVLLYTSGTSGLARGAMLPARALLANLAQFAAVEPPLVGAGDVVFAPLPLTHVFGLNAALGAALWFRTTLVLAERFDPQESLRTMAEERATVVLGVPGQYAAWLAAPGVADAFARVRLALSGSSTLARGVVDGFARLGVALHDGYGLTEAAPVVALTAQGGDREQPAPGTVGRPLPGVEVQLRDTDGDPVDEGDPGRIAVRGDNLFLGYWPDGSGGPDADGWFVTGDVAVADDAHRLRLVGRTSELVLVNGFNVYPAEVEAVLAADPEVAEVAVTGRPDTRTGEAVRAYVVPAHDTGLDVAALHDRAAASLARFKQPAEIRIVPRLPRTVTGKIMKWQLEASASPAEEDGDGAGS